MQTPPDRETLRAIHARMQAAAGLLRLPFRSRTWRGHSGNWLGAGIGSSIDFQDHRPYLPGDDPRYIDWQAYARTGNYTMKLYREEVSPLVDLVFDASESMVFEPQKMGRALELFYFCVESVLQSSASLRCFLTEDEEFTHTPTEQVLSHSSFVCRPRPSASPTVEFRHSAFPAVPRLDRIPFRQGSLRIFISDLLFTAAPENLLLPLSLSKGRGLVFVPFCAAEADPDWLGNVELIDCEIQTRRNQRVEPDLLARYQSTYARHFSLWREGCRKQAVVIARIPSEADFAEAMRHEALAAGAVEMR